MHVLLEKFKIGFAYFLSNNSIEHILFAFVLLLLINLKNWSKLLSAITFFTLGVLSISIVTNYNMVTLSHKYNSLLILSTLIVVPLYKILIDKYNTSTFYLFITFALGAIHGLTTQGNVVFNFGENTSFLNLFLYHVGVEVAMMVISLLAAGTVILVSFIAKVSQKNTESIFNTFCLLYGAFYLIQYFI